MLQGIFALKTGTLEPLAASSRCLTRYREPHRVPQGREDFHEIAQIELKRLNARGQGCEADWNEPCASDCAFTHLEVETDAGNVD
jgi:hypothetical protein